MTQGALLREGQREVSLRTASDAPDGYLSCQPTKTETAVLLEGVAIPSSCGVQRTASKCFLSAVTEMTDVSLSRML